MPSTDDYQLQDMLYRACNSTALARLNSVSITSIEKLICQISTNKTRLTYTIDVYDQWRQRKLPSMPNYERMLYHLDDSDNVWRRDIRATGMDGRWSTGSVRKWRYGGRDHFGMFSCFSLLFFSSLDLGPVQMASAWVFTTFGVSQGEVDFPRAPDLSNGRHQAVPIGCGTYGFVRLCT